MRLLALGILVSVIVLAVSSQAAEQFQSEDRDQPESTIRLTSSIQLARLVDLAAQQNRVEIEYNPSTLGKKSVTLRLVHEVTPAQLWDLCMTVLHSNDLTIIRRSGDDGLYAVVTLAEAAKEVLPQEGFLGSDLAPGYQSVIVRLSITEPAAIMESLKPLLGSGGKLSITEAP